MTNLEWIKSGKTGCTFASLFSKNPEMVGWKFYDYNAWKIRNLFQIEDALIVSICFPADWKKEDVRLWALKLNFYIENTSEGTEGLRIKCEEGIAWVQYFGPDSHVITRQSPKPMLLYCNKLNKSHYVKVGFKGILHLAHAWYEKISERVYDLLWDRSYKQTCKILGKKPTIKEAAKTTWIKSHLVDGLIIESKPQMIKENSKN